MVRPPSTRFAPGVDPKAAQISGDAGPVLTMVYIGDAYISTFAVSGLVRLPSVVVTWSALLVTGDPWFGRAGDPARDSCPPVR